MRILVIHPHLGHFGGSERLTRILVYELERLSQEVVVLTASRNEAWFPQTQNVLFETIKRRGDGPLLPQPHVDKAFDILTSLNEVIHRYQPDVVLSMIQEPVYLMLTNIVAPRIGTAIYIHYPVEEEVNEHNVYKFYSMYRFPKLYERFYKDVDIHMTNSNYTAAALYRMFNIESNVVYPAVEWDFFNYEPDLSERRESVILTVGRFVPQKRHRLIVDVFRRIVKPEVPDARLVIIGVPDKRHEEYYEELKSCIEDDPDIELIDRVLTNEELIHYYRMSKVYVHLRVGEHFGMVPVEAMSQGVIPIVPANSGIAEVISHGLDGYVFNNDDELVKYLLKTLKLSDEEASKFRRFAYRRAWYFNPDRFAKEVLHYLRLVAPSQKVG